MADFQKLRKHIYKRCNDMFTAFDRRRKILIEVASEFKPSAVSGLKMRTERLADSFDFDEEHKLLTTLPVQMLRTSAGGFLSNLTSPARQWFDLRPARAGESSHEEASALDHLRDEAEKTLQRSNAYSQCYKLFEDVMWAGFGCMMVFEDDRTVCSFQTLRIGTYALDIDQNGSVNRVARRFAWTPEQILEEFGPDWTPLWVKNLVKKASTERLEIWNLIEPNPQGVNRKFDPAGKDAQEYVSADREYRSFYVLKGLGATDNRGGEKCGILRIAGYRHNPIIAPRLDREQGDVYGLGRGIDGLHAARGIQTFKADELRIDGMRAQPPVVTTPEFKNRVQLGRRGVSVAKEGDTANNRIVPVFPTLPDASDTRQCILETKEELEKLFFVDAFAVIDSQKNNPGVKTATEIEYLKTENLAKLGAVTMNLNIEMLDPLVRTVVKYTWDSQMTTTLTDDDRAILQEAGLLEGIEIEYVSQIALAQKAGALSSVQQYISFAGTLAQMGGPENPLDMIDGDKTLRFIAETLNVPEIVHRDEKAVRATREAQAQAAAAAAQAEQIKNMAGAAKQIGEIPLDGTHVGGAIAEGLR